MVVAQLAHQYLSAPASATWEDIKGGVLRSFTKVDITNYMWNSLIASAPCIAGGVAANMLNTFIHQLFPRELPAKRIFSILSTAASVMVGTGVSFFVIKFLASFNGNLSPFTAEKALKFETLIHVTILAFNPIAISLRVPIGGLFFSPHFVLGLGGATGYFGQRSLYVLGALSALQWAVSASFFNYIGVPKQNHNYQQL